MLFAERVTMTFCQFATGGYWLFAVAPADKLRKYRVVQESYFTVPGCVIPSDAHSQETTR